MRSKNSSLPHTEEEAIKLLATKMRREKGTFSNSSMSIEDTTKKICELAREKHTENLKKFMTIRDMDILKSLAIQILAKAGSFAAVDFLIDQFKADKESAIKGFAWGAHTMYLFRFQSDNNKYIYDMAEGYALGKHTEEINTLIINETGNIDARLIKRAHKGLLEGGHIKDANETLELLALTDCKNLRKEIIETIRNNHRDTDVPDLLQQIKVLKLLMEKQNISYERALTIYKVANAEVGSTYSNSLTIFNDTLRQKFSYFKKQALNTIPELTEKILLNWKGNPYHKCKFSACHVETLKFLILEKKLSPLNAIQEINHLNANQASALKELHGHGLRGDQLRRWQEDHKNVQFTDTHLEKLIKLCTQQNMQPQLVLNQVTQEEPNRTFRM